jgi:phosphoglycerate dehydrogenase-like enzyme
VHKNGKTQERTPARIDRSFSLEYQLLLDSVAVGLMTAMAVGLLSRCTCARSAARNEEQLNEREDVGDIKEDFAGMTVVITGAAQGIGRAIAEEFQTRGARVVLVDCNVCGVAAAAESMRKRGLAAVDHVVADLSLPAGD